MDLTLWQRQTTCRRYSQESGPSQQRMFQERKNSGMEEMEHVEKEWKENMALSGEFPSGNSHELDHAVVGLGDSPEANVEHGKGPRKGKKRKKGGRSKKNRKKQRVSQEQANIDQVESTFTQSETLEALDQVVQTDSAAACSPTSINVDDRIAVVSVEGVHDAVAKPPSERTITAPSVGDEAVLEGTAKTLSLIPYICN